MSNAFTDIGPGGGSTDVIARVRVDLAVQHLDRDFDYLVPASDTEQVVPGSRVRVRFSGRLRDAYVIKVLDHADVESPRPLERVIDEIPPLTSETLELVEETARRFIGTFWDVVRAAVPARHARAEKAVLSALAETAPVGEPVTDGDPQVWEPYEWPTSRDSPERVVWSSAPATDAVKEVVDLVTRQRRAGLGALVVMPDVADVERLRSELVSLVGKSDLAVLTADQGPERRYREFLRVRTGQARTVIGTRNAVFAPVADLGAVIVWDDGDDVYRDPQAPYWDAREVAALRAHLSGCSLYVGSPSRSVVTQWWCDSGWANSVVPKRPSWWRVQAIDEREIARDPAAQSARIPTAAWQVAHDALSQGPVLFQVLRRGYVPMLACQQCRSPALCANVTCGGALEATSGHAVASCARCGALAGSWRCPHCSAGQLRAVTVGAARTAEELGRAFPGVPIVWSEADRIVRDVDDKPAVVVATFGAEPIATSGYRAVVLLDARFVPATLAGPEQQLRRWFSAARLVSEGGQVCVVADPAMPAVQSLIRWDAAWFAEREIVERRAVGLPPVTRVAELVGPAAGVAAFVTSLTVTHRVLGPVPVTDESGRNVVRSYVVVPRSMGGELTSQLTAAVRRASTVADSTREVRVRMDPRDM